MFRVIAIFTCEIGCLPAQFNAWKLNTCGFCAHMVKQMHAPIAIHAYMVEQMHALI